MPDYTVGDTVFKRFTTRQFSDGVPTILSGTPVVSAYEDDSITQITAGITLGVDHDSVVGLNLLTIVATGANGYEAGKSYDLVITTGTVGGVSVVGEVVWHFTLSAEAAAVDLANGTDGLGAIKAETALIVADTNELQVDWVNGGRLDLIIDAILVDTAEIGTAGAGLSDITLNAASIDLVWDEVLTGATHNVVNSSGRRLRQIQEGGSYSFGHVFIDTVGGTAGTTNFENGVEINPVDSIGDANTIASSVGLNRFAVSPGSSITFAATQADEEFEGEGWTLALGGQSVSGSHFQGADVSGTGTGASEIHFEHCELGTITITGAHFDDCDIEGTVTCSAAATYLFINCSHSGGTATIDFGSAVGVNTTVHVHNYHGALTIANMGQSGTDVLHFSSPDGKLTLAASCIGGTVNMNGTFDFVNSGSGLTINDDGAILETVGIITDSAAAGDPTSTDTIVQYLKQLVNVLVGTDGVVTFPAAAAPGNGVSLAEVLRATFDDTNSLDGAKIPDTLSLANINAEVDTALDTAISELAQGAPTATPSVRTGIMLGYMALRNKLDVATVATDTLELHNDAGTRIAQKLLTDDGTDYSEAKMTSGA